MPTTVNLPQQLSKAGFCLTHSVVLSTILMDISAYTIAAVARLCSQRNVKLTRTPIH
ncbi:hypothetical protein H6G64_03945 [Calothrix sp. FACHB-156]|nr:hypothetical protein [Calothrix sp. FACHB-156]